MTEPLKAEKTKSRVFLMLFTTTVFCITGCGSSSSTSASGSEDTSASGSVAAAVGGAYNGSSSSGTQALIEQPFGSFFRFFASLNPVQQAYASSACPRFSSSSLASCLSSPQSLTYSDCNFSNSSATWNGGVTLTCSGTVNSPTVERAFSNGTTRTNSYGTVVAIKTNGISTFNSASIAGGGTTVSPSSVTIGGVELTGTRNGSEVYDHVITSSALSLSNNTVSGTVTAYHNLAKVIGTAAVDLTFSSGCCTPTGGSISTSFQAYGVIGAKSGFNGTTETLTFNGCGSATYTGPEGYSGSVTIANCM